MINYEPIATDNCGGPVTVICDPPSGTMFPVGTTTVTYTAVDDASNVTTASFTVTVTDDELPVITGIPADIVASTERGLVLDAWNRTEAGPMARGQRTDEQCPIGGLVLTRN